MSGKRAKPSPWRFVRLVPVLLVSMVVCAMLGLFLLFQDPGDDQAHDWGLDPVPSSTHDEGSGGPEPSADSFSPSASTRATPPGQPTPVVRRDASPVANQTPDPPAAASTARRERTPASPPVHRPTRPPAPETTVPHTGPPTDNPGKKKGHRKHHARQGDQR